jgi:hypothetical protein
MIRALKVLFALPLAGFCFPGVNAQQEATQAQLPVNGIYRSEVQVNSDGIQYISALRFSPDGRALLTHVSLPAPQDRLCEWFRAGREKPNWGQASEYRLEGGRLSFQTTSLNSTTQFDGAIQGDVLQMQLTVLTMGDLTYSLRFEFGACP